MKIRITLFACLFMVQVASYAQKSDLTFNTGASIPVGKFANKDDDPKSGYASTGLYLNLRYSYKLNKIVGIGGSLKYFQNGSDTKALQDAFNKNYSPYIANEPSADKYTGIGILGGLSFNVPTGDKIETTFLLNAGVMSLRNPAYKYFFSYNNSIGWMEQTEKTVSSFSYELAVNFKYALTNNLDILLNAGFVGNKADLKDLKTTFSNGNILLYSVNAPLNTVQMGAGLSYQF